MNILDLFGSNVNKYRKMKGYSQEKLAELTGLHRTYIGDIELRKRNISLNNIQKIADALDVPYHLLFLKSDMDTTTQKDNRITIMSYEQFKEELNNSIKLEDNFYYDWLVDMLRKLGCRYVQGYYYSKPIPAENYVESFCGEIA